MKEKAVKLKGREAKTMEGKNSVKERKKLKGMEGRTLKREE